MSINLAVLSCPATSGSQVPSLLYPVIRGFPGLWDLLSSHSLTYDTLLPCGTCHAVMLFSWYDNHNFQYDGRYVDWVHSTKISRVLVI